MPTQLIEITPIGFDEAASHLDLISHKLEHSQPVFEIFMEFIEKSERRLFKNLRGKYVDTGALMASLTESGGQDAIREAHDDQLDFGSSLFYAKYQRDPKSRKSAVLKFLPKERKEAGEAALGYILFNEAYL